MRFKNRKLFFGLILGFCVTGLLQASFHTWDISEIYSNSDGSVQFIELVNGNFNSQDEFDTRTISSNGNVYTFTSDLSVGNSTANLRLIIGTAGYGAAAGSVPADYNTLPANFFDPTGDTINFAGVDAVTFTNLPTNGIDSFNYSSGNGGGLTTAANSPTNLAGQIGAVGVPEPSSIMVLMGIAGVAVCRRRR